MFHFQIAVLASVLALAHSGLLDGYGGIGGGLGGGIGGGLGGGLGGYGGISLGGGEGGYGGHKETFIDYRVSIYVLLIGSVGRFDQYHSQISWPSSGLLDITNRFTNVAENVLSIYITRIVCSFT